MDRFRAGYVYAVGTTLGCYLLAIGAAEPVPDDGAALTFSPEQQLFGPVVLGRSYRPVAPVPPAPIERPAPNVRQAPPIAQAADREARTRKAAPRATAAKRPLRKDRR